MYSFDLIKYRIKSCFKKTENIVLLYGFEGLLIAMVNNLIANNNNLFATRLGAEDFKLSLVTGLPHVMAMIVLLPGGIIIDNMSGKRKAVIASILTVGLLYISIAFAPFLGSGAFIAFLILLTLSAGAMTLYNLSWQAHFSDIVQTNKRNATLTLRTKLTFLVGIIMPIITGSLLTSAKDVGGKIFLHQVFFVCAATLTVCQALMLYRLPPRGDNKPSGFSFNNIKKSIAGLAVNRPFKKYVVVVIFFYMTWMMDWTLYYIGQVKYLNFTENKLSLVVICAVSIQFLGVKFWSRVNEKKGVNFSMIFGAIGLSFCPLVMNLATSLAAPYNAWVFIVLNSMANFAFPTVALNPFQCLLKVLPPNNRTLSISIYTTMVSFSNALMPVLGVKIYTSLGGDLAALQKTFFIVYALRLFAILFWILRYRGLRKENET